MKYTKAKLDEFLGIKSHSNKPNTVYDSQGPSHLAGTLLYIEDNQNAWIKQKPAKVEKIKVILSDPFIAMRALNDLELGFFSTLFEYYPVYMWPKTDVPITFNEFLKYRNKVKPEADFNVRQELSRTGVQADPLHVKVLDYANFTKIIEQQKLDIENTHPHEVKEKQNYFQHANTQLNLINCNLLNADEKKFLLSGIDVKQIKKIRFGNVQASELKEILRTFPKLEEIEIDGANIKWLTNNAHLLLEKKIALSNFKLESNVLTLPENLNIKTLHISPIDTNKTTHLTIYQNNQSLKNLKIDLKVEVGRSEALNLDLSHLENIEILNLKNSKGELIFNNLSKLKKMTIHSLKGLDLSKAHSLEELELNIFETESKLDTLQKLKKININNKTVSTLDLSKSKSLEYLKIDRLGNDLVLPEVATLKQLNLNKGAYSYGEFKIETQPDSLKNLESLEIRNSNVGWVLTEQQVPKLKNAYIELSPKIRLKKEINTTMKEDEFLGKRRGYIADSRSNPSSVTVQYSKEVKTENLKSATELHLEKNYDLTSMEIPSENCIKILTCAGCPKLFIEQNFTKNLMQLETLKINNLQVEFDEWTPEESKKIDLSTMPSLKEADIKCFFKPGTQFIVPNKALRKLCIESKDLTTGVGEIVIDLTGCENLYELEIKCSLPVKLKGLSSCHNLCNAKIETPNYPDDLYNLLEFPNLDLKYTEYVKPVRVTATSSVGNRSATTPSDNMYNMDQYFANERATTSCLRLLNKSARPDGRTALNKTPRNNSDSPLRATLFSDLPISKNNYRFQIYDNIKWNSVTNDIEFEYVIDEKKMKNVPSFTAENDATFFRDFLAARDQDPKLIIGNLSGTLPENEWCPLPTLQPPANKDAIKIGCNNPDVEFFWYEPHKQYYCKLKEGAENTNVNIFYSLPENRAYEMKNFNQDYYTFSEEEREKFLPQELYNRLDTFLHEVIKEQPELGFLIDPKLSTANKIDILKTYCKFDNESLTSEPENTFEALKKIIRERKGSCRHRAWAFMLLARYLNVPANNTINELHSFCEIPYYNKQKDQWEMQRVDMGGGIFLDNTPINERKNPFEEYIKMRVIPQMKEPSPAYKKYYNHFKSLSDQLSIQTIEPLIKEQKKSPVIELSADQNPWLVSQEIRSQLSALDKNFNATTDYFYIDHPKDFYAFLQTYRLENGKRSEKPIPGPLRHFLNNPNGILVVNWSNFTPTEIANFKSVIDREPTLLSHTASIKKVIGLVKPETIVSEDFSSRTKRYVLDKAFFTDKPTPPAKSPMETEEIDLHHQADWREFLLGKVMIDGHRIDFQPSRFLSAVEKNQPAAVTVCNIPEDSDCERMINHLQFERKLFYNGTNYTVPENFTVSVQKKENQYKLPEYVTVKTTNDLPSPNAAKYMNSLNWHELFESLQVNNKDGSAKLHQRGYLAKDEAISTFLLTESITKENWNYLLLQMEILHKEGALAHKAFEFILAPGVSIEKVMSNDNSNKVQNKVAVDQLNTVDTPVYISNDPDFVALKLKELHPDAVMIDASSDADFTSLIANISQVPSAHGYNFTYTENAVLSALKNGKKVILNAALSGAAYQQLLPFLKAPARISINNETIDVDGQLMLVLPQHAAKQINMLTQTTELDVTWNHYYKAFPHDKTLIDQIAAFYNLAERFPHRGAGRPTEPRISFYRLQKMLNTLKTKSLLHGNNPIKSNFHYDYPKNSEDYAYLNTIAKWQFSQAKQPQINMRKLNQLIDQLGDFNEKIIAENIWHFLNCCNGPMLRDILGTDLQKSIIFSANERPKLSADFVKHFRQVIAKHVAKSETLKESHSRTYKLEIAFKEFLQNDTHSIFFLKGDPGAGKTYSTNLFKKQPNVNLIQGKNAIERWLNAPNKGEYNVLFWDEMNVAEPGTLDFLKAIGKIEKDEFGKIKDRIIYYKGQPYTITDKHKIFATGNFEYTEHRYYQTLLQDFATTFYLPKPNESEVIEKVLAPKLQTFLNTQEYQQCESIFLDIYQNFNIFNPHIILTLRDMNNLVWRFKTLWQDAHSNINAEQPQKSLPELLYATITGELSGMIPDHDKRLEFIDYIATKLDIPDQVAEQNSVISLSADTVLPSEKEYLVKAIEQDLRMQKSASKEPNQYYKQAILLEGGSGIGKSTLLEAILKKNGYALNAEDPTKRYYIISGGDKNASAVFKKAAQEGSKIILNEFNLFDEEFNKLLLHSLNVHDPAQSQNEEQDAFALHPDTFIFASQNPSYFPGRNTVDAPIINRVHFMYMDSYSNTELEKFAHFYNIEDPHEFIQAYRKANEENPSLINMRTLFEVLKYDFSKQMEIDDTHKQGIKRKAEVLDPMSALCLDVFISKLADELDKINLKKESMVFLGKKIPPYIFQLKNLDLRSSEVTQEELTVNVIKILLHARENDSLFSSDDSATLTAGLRALNLSEDQFKQQYSVDHMASKKLSS